LRGTLATVDDAVTGPPATGKREDDPPTREATRIGIRDHVDGRSHILASHH
jgi:hypothetical protein